MFYFQKKGCGGGGKIIVPILKLVLKCLQCCVACFERFMKFININAYIETGIFSNDISRCVINGKKL